jgi:hypothetical protein
LTGVGGLALEEFLVIKKRKKKKEKRKKKKEKRKKKKRKRKRLFSHPILEFIKLEWQLKPDP